MNVLTSLIDFLSILCKEHNTIFQAFMVNQSLSTKEGDKLVNLLLNLQIDIIALLEYCLPNMTNLNKFRKQENIHEYFINLFTSISNFFINVIQGSYPYVYLTCLGIYKKNNNNKDAIYNYAEWIDMNFKLIDNFLQNDAIFKDFLTSFLVIITCLIEENASLDNKVLSRIDEINKFRDYKLNNKLYLKKEKKIDDCYNLIDEYKKSPNRSSIQNTGRNTCNEACKEKTEAYILPKPNDYHYIQILKKLNVPHLYSVCKKSLEIAYRNKDKASKSSKYSNKVEDKDNIDFIEAYKYNTKFANSDYVKISFLIFKYINRISLSEIKIPLNKMELLTEFLNNIRTTTKSFLQNHIIREDNNHFKFLQTYLGSVEVQNIISDYCKINPYQANILSVNFDEIKGVLPIKSKKKIKKAYFFRNPKKVLLRELFVIPPECCFLMSKENILTLAERQKDVYSNNLAEILKVITKITTLVNERYLNIQKRNVIFKIVLTFMFENEDNFFYFGGLISVMLAFIANGFIIKNISQGEIQKGDEYVEYNTFIINYFHISYNIIFLVIWAVYHSKYAYIKGNNIIS